MKLNNMIIKILVVTTFILIIANYLTLAHLIYTRISLSQPNDLLDSYNLNVFFMFVILIFAADKLKAKKTLALSFAGAALSAIFLLTFTVLPIMI